MKVTELMHEGDHLMTVCNACRYCEGYCAVWQAMERRLVFSEGDLNYLANLCHNCSDCYYACQYAPPHEFDINPPKTLAKIRAYTYQLYAWPGPLAAAFRKNGLVVSLITVLSLIGFLFGVSALAGEGRLLLPVPGGDFYRITSHDLLTVIFGAVGLFAVLALLIGFLRFWRNVGEPYSELAKPGAWVKAARDVLRLEYLNNDGYGCTYPGEQSSQALRWFHHLTFYGFALCFVATTLGAIYHYGFGWNAPYGYGSLPVLFGTAGGVGLAIGPIGLWALKCRRNRKIVDESQYGMDVSFLALVWLSGISGLLLLGMRETAAMPSLLIVHLGIVMALFLTLPYGKFVHAVYRSAAVLKYALERERPPEHNVEV
jgi:citrate/tricarballylate utilization protein